MDHVTIHALIQKLKLQLEILYLLQYLLQTLGVKNQ